MRPIIDVATDRLGIPGEAVPPYGKFKGKVALDYIGSLAERRNGKLILVTAINPTPAGEGKTTTTVGLGDALNHISKGDDLPARGESRALLRREGWRRRLRLCSSGADGGHHLKAAPKDHVVEIRKVRLSAGAEFVVVICGDICRPRI